MEYEFLKVSCSANFLSDLLFAQVRVNRESELSSLLHLTTKINENVLLTGDRGQGKSFLTRMYREHLTANYKEIFSVRIDLSSLGFFIEKEDFLITYFPSLILDQLCKEVWRSLLKRDYSELLSTSDKQNNVKLFKSKSEKRLIEIYNILKREDQKFINEMRSLVGASFGVKGEINLVEKKEWVDRKLQSFEILELIKEIKDTILKEHCKTKIMLICDEANKLTKKDQYYILQNYLDFFGANQFNFLIVASDFDKLKSKAEESGLFRVIELSGLNTVSLLKQLIANSFYLDKLNVDELVYNQIYRAFLGHIRLSISTFSSCIAIMLKKKKNEINSEITTAAIKETKEQIKQRELVSSNYTHHKKYYS